MRATKPGLADLKRLRQQALESAEPTPVQPAAKAGRSSKRHKFMAPGQAKPAAAASQKKARPGHDKLAGGPITENVPDAEALPDADKALFRQVVQSVRRLPVPDRALLPPVPTAPQQVLKQRRLAASGTEPATLSQVSDHYAPPSTASDSTRFMQNGHGPDLLKNLERGKWPIGASLDLHGATLDEARPRLDAFLNSCIEHQIRGVRIVHGKGHGSKDNTPVLKETVRRWLTQLEAVMAYVECAERDGGAGAVLVLLRPGET